MLKAAPFCAAALFVCLIAVCAASNGDRTQFFYNCRANCERNNCTADGIHIQEQAVGYYKQSFLDSLFQWTCADECQYGCMWLTVNAFRERGWNIPQFYGKWPFVKVLGLQEPASVFFSMLNFIAHVRLLRKLRRQVAHDSPCFKIWHIFSLVSINGWIWSTVFHTRDFPLTELLDYGSAYSITLTMLYCTIYRMIHKWPVFLRGLITLLFLTYFINYVAYLNLGQFSYELNMKVNIVTGALSALIWFVWCFLVRQKRQYYKKVLRFYILVGLAMSLELFDFPPIAWALDAHALWHLATAFIVSTFYDFIILDCRALLKDKQLSTHSFNKNI